MRAERRPAHRGGLARTGRRLVAAAALAVAAACATAPPAPPPTPPPPTLDQKLGWILRLEDQRVLREPAPAEPAAPAAVAVPATRGAAPVVAPSPPPERPDLVRLVGDQDARVRRSAALAIGRVGLADGVAPLVGALGDPEMEVRQMAAFSLGLLGNRAALAPLVQALTDDESPVVRGRAAEALGRIGDRDAAQAIGRMVGEYVQQGVLGSIGADDQAEPPAPPVEAVRLGLFALARLKAYEPLASAMLGRDGLPVSRWWPVAYAFAHVGDPRALTILMHLASGAGVDTVALAARGLGDLQNPSAVRVLTPLLDPATHDPRVVAAVVRALVRIGGEAPKALVDLLARPTLDPNIRLEAVTAVGAMKAASALDWIVDRVADPSPAMRAAAIQALARIDSQTFVLVLSGLPPDPQWRVRAAVASALGELDYATAAPRLKTLLDDADRRVVAAALDTLVRLRAPSVAATLLARLGDEDPVVRMAAARGLGVLKPAGGAAALAAAYRAAADDPTYVARAAALAALAAYGPAAALPTVKAAFADRDWAVRVRAAALAAELDPSGSYQDAVRPAPGGPPPGVDRYDDPALIAPAFSPQLYVDTDKGTIQIELAVLDAPLTTRALVGLVRRGFYTGLIIHRVVAGFVAQMGDPRGDGEGGPGFTLRDEINERPYLRGTVGMALDWADTGGSQFFITVAPEPQLDGRYTVVGTVVGGMEVVDRLEQGDTIRRVRVWDGVTMSGGAGG